MLNSASLRISESGAVGMRGLHLSSPRLHAHDHTTSGIQSPTRAHADCRAPDRGSAGRTCGTPSLGSLSLGAIEWTRSGPHPFCTPSISEFWAPLGPSCGASSENAEFHDLSAMPARRPWNVMKRRWEKLLLSNAIRQLDGNRANRACAVLFTITRAKRPSVY